MQSTIQETHTTSWLSLLTLIALMLVFAAATGRLDAHAVDDTQSYLEYPLDSLDAALRSHRTPGYPILLKIVGATLGIAAMPWVQLILHATAAWSVLNELRRWGSDAATSWAAALAIAFGCTALDNLGTLATDAPAASLGVMTAVSLMRWARLGGTIRLAWPVIAFALLAIMMRPAYLALIPWTLVAGVLLRCLPRRDQPGVSFRKALCSSLAVSAMIAIPMIGWMSLRGVVVDDFGILPFGHQNLAGITVQLVTEDELLATSGEPGKLAKEIVHQQELREGEGFQFAQGDPRATMTMEARWNELIYLAVVPAASVLHPRDAIASHNAIAALNKDILRRYPLRYVRWLLLAARRGAWGIAADIVMNPIFLACIGLALLWEIARLVIGRRSREIVEDDALAALFVVGVSYCLIKVAFVILTSPPLGRFADAAAIFLPAWLAAKLVQHFSERRFLGTILSEK